MISKFIISVLVVTGIGFLELFAFSRAEIALLRASQPEMTARTDVIVAITYLIIMLVALGFGTAWMQVIWQRRNEH